MKKRTTIVDIANEANLSAMTVSKALNNKEGVSEETRKLILDIARRMHYTPNMIAQSLRMDKTRTIGVVLSDSSEMVTALVLRGLEDAAAKNGYSILLANTNADSETEMRAIRLLFSKRIDGLVLVAPLLETLSEMEAIKAYATPVVILMRHSLHGDVDEVVNDNFQGSYELTRYLIETGSREIAFLRLPHSSQIGEERMQGSWEALRANGLVLGENRTIASKASIQGGYDSTKALLAQARFDTLVCGCDTIAIGAIEALSDAGFAVPEQIRVCGYDGIEMGKYLHVPLTTMRQPLYEIGENGANMLFERIKAPDAPQRRCVLKSQLVARRST